MKKMTAILVMAGMMVSPAVALVTVDNTGAGDQTTIQAGIDAATAGEEVVVVNTGTPYDEAISITKDLILRGEDPADPPIVALRGNSGTANGDGDGLYIEGPVTVTVQNFIIIPSTDASYTDDLIMASPATAGDVMNITLENLHLTGNDGSDAPVVPYGGDIFTAIDTSVAGTVWSNDSIYLLASSAVTVDGTINATLTDVKVLGTGADDAIVCYTGSNGSQTYSGVVVTYAPDDGIQPGTLLTSDGTALQGTLTITGTDANPGLIIYETGDGVSLFETQTVIVDHLVAINNGSDPASDQAFYVSADDVESITLTDSLFVGNANGFLVAATTRAGNTTTIDVSNTTFFASAGADLFLGASLDAATVVNATDSIFAVSATGIDNAGAATASADYVGLVTSGPYALGAATNGTVATTNVINDNPQFLNATAPPVTDTSFAVTNSVYQGASSTVGDLTGWGTFVVETNAQSWELYR